MLHCAVPDRHRLNPLSLNSENEDEDDPGLLLGYAALIEPGNQPRGAGAVDIVFAVKLRA
jgi:hypothetical protein